MIGLKTHNLKRTLLFVVPAAIVITLILSYNPLLVTSFASNTLLHPTSIVSSGQPESNVPLTKLATYTTGLAPGKQMDSAGIPITVRDSSHIMLTLYDGNSANSTTIVATATNISTEPVTINYMNIIGATVNKKGNEFTNLLNSPAIGCTGGYEFPNTVVTAYANGTSVSHTENQKVICINQASHVTTTLQPGESITASVNTPLVIGGQQISQLSINAAYSTSAGNAEYSMVLPYQTIK